MQLNKYYKVKLVKINCMNWIIQYSIKLDKDYNEVVKMNFHYQIKIRLNAIR